MDLMVDMMPIVISALALIISVFAYKAQDAANKIITIAYETQDAVHEMQKGALTMAEYVDLDEIVLAEVYDNKRKEWIMKNITVRDYLQLGCVKMPPIIHDSAPSGAGKG